MVRVAGRMDGPRMGLQNGTGAGVKASGVRVKTPRAGVQVARRTLHR